jgi:plastocyanin
MMRTRRTRWMSVFFGAGAVVGTVIVASPAHASGGGGCGRPVTDARGVSVAIRTFCFAPTILHVGSGQAVTWTNADPFAHNVMGASASWGSFDLLKPGRSVTYRFTRAGTYPFVCTMHAGMVGAVVVGDGDGPPGAGTTTRSGPVVRVPRGSVSQASVGGSSAGAWPAATFVGFGLFLAAITALTVQRRVNGRTPPHDG